jgi:hypothetical protein
MTRRPVHEAGAKLRHMFEKLPKNISAAAPRARSNMMRHKFLQGPAASISL